MTKFFYYKKQNFFCEKIKVSDICKKVDTPFYLYSYNSIVNNYNKLANYFKGMDIVIAYSMKANSNLSVLKTLARCGSGADIVSMGELKKAIKAGIPKNKIVYSGVGKSEKEIIYALENRIEQFNVESLEELKTIGLLSNKRDIKANIALRVNPDVVAGGHPKISTGKKTDKFGIPLDNAIQVYDIANKFKNINVVGIDIHIGSQILDVKPFKAAFNKVINFCYELEKIGYKIKNIDLGGGIGVNYDDKPENIMLLSKYVELVKFVYKKTKKRIFLEPGRFLLANSGVLITKVLYKKTIDKKNFLIVDAGMNDFLRPALYDAKHLFKPLINTKYYNKLKSFEVVGPICESADVLAKNVKLPENISQDDYYFIDKVGAYGSVMSSNYNSKGLSSEVMVKEDSFYEIRKRIEIEDFIKFEKIAPWLKKN